MDYCHEGLDQIPGRAVDTVGVEPIFIEEHKNHRQMRLTSKKAVIFIKARMGGELSAGDWSWVALAGYSEIFGVIQPMKTRTLSLGAATVFGLLAATTPMTYGQIPVETRTTITSTGTVTELAPDAIAVKVRTSAAPIHYSFTKTTTYVDENGNPVSVETVRTGVPVTVYYEKSGDNFVADKVVVKKSVTTTDQAVPAVIPPSASPSTPPSADGVITGTGIGDMSMRSTTSGSRMNYDTGDSTAYVDENGNPLSKDALKEGTPVTVFYERDGDSLRATRVVVRSPVQIERRTTTTQETTVPQ